MSIVNVSSELDELGHSDRKKARADPPFAAQDASNLEVRYPLTFSLRGNCSQSRCCVFSS